MEETKVTHFALASVLGKALSSGPSVRCFFLLRPRDELQRPFDLPGELPQLVFHWLSYVAFRV